MISHAVSGTAFRCDAQRMVHHGFVVCCSKLRFESSCSDHTELGIMLSGVPTTTCEALFETVVQWVTIVCDATVVCPEKGERPWWQLTVLTILHAAVYKEACAHHDEDILLIRKMEPDPLKIQFKEEEGDEIFGGFDAGVEICELGAEPPEPVMDAAPIEQVRCHKRRRH